MDLLKSFWIMSLVNVFMALPWTLIFLFVRWSGLRLYYLRNRELCRRIQKRLGTECTHTVDGKLGAGYAIGRWYLISMEISRGHFNDGDTYNVWLITTEKQFQDLTMSLEENEIFSPLPTLIPIRQTYRMTRISRRSPQPSPQRMTTKPLLFTNASAHSAIAIFARAISPLRVSRGCLIRRRLSAPFSSTFVASIIRSFFSMDPLAPANP